MVVLLSKVVELAVSDNGVGLSDGVVRDGDVGLSGGVGHGNGVGIITG